MKKLLLVTTLFITALSLNAQTEFTYTGTGNWTDQANWSPSYPGDNGLNNSNYTINIDGVCLYNVSQIFIDAELNISGTLNTNSSFFVYNTVSLNGGTITFEIVFGNGNGSVFQGTGNINGDNFTFEMHGFTFNPGDANMQGTLSFGGSTNSTSSIIDCNFIFDIYTTLDYDQIINMKNDDINSNNNLGYNLIGTNGFSHNDTFILFSNTDTTMFNSLSLPSTITNGFQPQFNFVSSASVTNGDITLTLLDIEAPTITNCSGDQNVTADCGIYYEIPDYTTTTIATDNSANTITYTQSPKAGLGAIDGTVVTITATDAAGNSSDCSFTLNVTQQTLANPEAGDVVSRNISLFPNPSKGVFTLKNTSGLLLETGQVLDAKGALIKTIDLSSYNPNKTIDLGSLSAGIYVFKILTVDGFVTKKISIE